jgi:hypothetical protein
LDYVYNNNFLYMFLAFDQWFPLGYSKIPKYQDALKLLTTILHALFFQYFAELQALPQEKYALLYVKER